MQGFRAAAAAEEKARRDKDFSEQSRKELSARLTEKSEELKAIGARVSAQKEVCVCLCLCICVYAFCSYAVL